MENLAEGFRHSVEFSNAYHPQTNAQTERVIIGGYAEKHLSLIEFAYNNSYHFMIGMAPYEALYGRSCRSSFVGQS